MWPAYTYLLAVAVLALLLVAYLTWTGRIPLKRIIRRSQGPGPGAPDEGGGGRMIGRIPTPEFGLRHIAMILLVVALVIVIPNSYAIVPPAHRGLRVTMGELEDYSYPEGVKFKIPFVQRFIIVPVYAYSARVIESTASSDLQEIQTQLSVQYKVIASRAHEVYRNYLFDWEITQIKPIIYEEMKATTADWTAEQLIQERPLVMAQLRDQLRHRLEPLGFEVMSVNIEDLQFSPEYWDAIEKKAVAVQNALAEKNKLEVVRYQQQQKIVVQEAERNMTIIRAEAEKEKSIREAEGKAQAIYLEANATATGEFLRLQAISRGIEKIKEQLTADYIDYLVASGWDGKLPLLFGGDGATILDLRTLFESYGS